jgi:N6-adenosine-specific RNA methylase IME4
VSVKYRTIVADPPWRYKSSLPVFGGGEGTRSEVPYGTMGVPDLCALPVGDLADENAHLYLWTTNTHIEQAWAVARAWGFSYSTLLVWCKSPRGAAGFPTFAICSEYVLFCYRGRVDALSRVARNWWEWPRGPHSAKPEAFLDLVEQVSPSPRLELFARRNRLGWDTWGHEALNHVDMGNPA